MSQKRPRIAFWVLAARRSARGSKSLIVNAHGTAGEPHDGPSNIGEDKLAANGLRAAQRLLSFGKNRFASSI